MNKKRTKCEDEKIPSQWLNLPSDLAMDNFRNYYYQNYNPRTKPAAGTVEQALISVEKDNMETSKSIRDCLFAKREKNERGRLPTIPRAVFWEARELISAILHTYQNNRSQVGEEHAERVLEELTTFLKVAGFDGLEEDYVKLMMLNNAGVQEKLIDDLENELQRRWERLKKLVVTDKLLETTEKVKLTLEQLDGIIAEVCDDRKIENDTVYKIKNERCPQTTAVLDLYRDLVSERRKLLPQSEKSLPSMEYQWAVSEENKSLVKAMQEMLKKHGRGKNECSCEEFIKVYNLYLCSQLQEETKKRAIDFAQVYIEIANYINGDGNAEQFINAIQEELKLFAKDIFDDLERLDMYGYAYSRYNPSKAIDAHFRTRLADIHRDIQMSIHEPIMRLRIAYTVFHFLLYPGVEQGNCCNLTPKGKADMEKLVGRMRQLVHAMERDMEGIANLTASETIQYSKLYNAKVVPMMECSIIDGESLKELISYMNSDNQDDYINKWKATTKLLTYQCRMVVALKVEKSIDEITKEYKDFCEMIRSNSVYF